MKEKSMIVLDRLSVIHLLIVWTVLLPHFTAFPHFPPSPFLVTPVLLSVSVCLLLLGLVGSLFCFAFLFNSVLCVFHICMKLYGICLSLSDLFHLVQYPQGPSMLSQMARYYLFLMSE